MKLITIQDKEILNIINTKNKYQANYNNIRYSQYKKQYKKLADLCGLKHCPIFCVPEANTTALYNTELDPNTVTLYLDIEDTRCIEMDYYDWASYLYYSSGEEYDEYFNFNEKQALKNIDKYIKLGESKYPQIIIEQINKSDIVRIEETI